MRLMSAYAASLTTPPEARGRRRGGCPPLTRTQKIERLPERWGAAALE